MRGKWNSLCEGAGVGNVLLRSSVDWFSVCKNERCVGNIQSLLRDMALQKYK